MQRLELMPVRYLARIRVDQPALAALTLERYDHGIDRADALQLVGALTAVPLGSPAARLVK